jgi:hypothetical protein
MNDSNCEIYIIQNAFALTRREESSLEWIESKLLRLEYVDALIAACFNEIIIRYYVKIAK